MVNLHEQVLCDASKIILEDHVCLYPGYLEVKDGRVLQHYSDDPNNAIEQFLTNERGEVTGTNPAWNATILKNRKEFRRVEDRGEAHDVLKAGHFHFINEEAMHKFIAFTEGSQEKAVEQVAPSVVGEVAVEDDKHCSICKQYEGTEVPEGTIHEFETVEHPYKAPAVDMP